MPPHKTRTVSQPLVTLQDVCYAARRAGLYFARVGPAQYVIRPRNADLQHAEIVHALRQHKATIVELLEAHTATTLFTTPPRVVLCPRCRQQVYEWVGLDAPQLAEHRVPDGTAWCDPTLPWERGGHDASLAP